MPIAYPLNVLYKGAREHTRVCAIDQIPVVIAEMQPEGGPVCSMDAQNGARVDWYQHEGKFYRTLIAGQEGGQHTVRSISQLENRRHLWSCVSNHTYGVEDGHDHPGGYINAFQNEMTGSLLFEAIVEGRHPNEGDSAPKRPPKDIQSSEKDGAWASALKRIQMVRRFGDLILMKAELPTFGLRIMSAIPHIDIDPHVHTSTFIGSCVTIPFGLGELEIAKTSAAELVENQTLRAGYRFGFEDRSARLTVHDESILDYVNREHQDALFLRNLALSLYTCMSYGKIPDVPFGAIQAYVTARSAADAYFNGDHSLIDDAMLVVRQMDKTGLEILDIAIDSIRVVSDIRTDIDAELAEGLEGLSAHPLSAIPN